MLTNIADKDINDVFDDILFGEEKIIKHSYEEGFKLGASQGNPEGYHLGYHRGAELGAELGFYLGVIESYLKNTLDQQIDQHPEKIETLKILKESIDNFPTQNVETVDVLETINNIRSRYKKVCAQLKINLKYPESDKFSF